MNVFKMPLPLLRVGGEELQHPLLTSPLARRRDQLLAQPLSWRRSLALNTLAGNPLVQLNRVHQLFQGNITAADYHRKFLSFQCLSQF